MGFVLDSLVGQHSPYFLRIRRHIIMNEYGLVAVYKSNGAEMQNEVMLCTRRSLSAITTCGIFVYAVINIFSGTTRGSSHPPSGHRRAGELFQENPKDLVVIPILVAKHLVVISILKEKRL